MGMQLDGQPNFFRVTDVIEASRLSQSISVLTPSAAGQFRKLAGEAAERTGYCWSRDSATPRRWEKRRKHQTSQLAMLIPIFNICSCSMRSERALRELYPKC